MANRSALTGLTPGAQPCFYLLGFCFALVSSEKPQVHGATINYHPRREVLDEGIRERGCHKERQDAWAFCLGFLVLGKLSETAVDRGGRIAVIGIWTPWHLPKFQVRRHNWEIERRHKRTAYALADLEVSPGLVHEDTVC
jgi:hypothetical protein